jgi:DNA gyrase subunit A
MMDFTDGKVLPIDIEQEMKKSYMLYSMSTIVSRALPDVRDGLKPVHRKILYSMYRLRLNPGSPYRKSAAVVGDVIGTYHPHGDAATYDSIVRMAQDFSLRYPLVDGHGNFGSIDGDPAAAYRYTEVRMTRIATYMLSDIQKDTVDFVPNYDGTTEEPVVLPARIPNLLINGVSGIAVGMATNIPPHNLGEVVDAIAMLIDDPDVSIDQLMTKIKGPDFPGGGIILGRSGIKSAYETGRGTIKVRARCRIETTESGKSSIIVTELPYMVNKARLIEKIADLHKERKIEGISNLNDETDRSGMRIVIELKRDANPNVVLNRLYKHTQLEDTFGTILLVLVDNQPRVLNLKEILQHYIDHQRCVIVRRTQYDLKEAQDRAHILEGLRIALSHIDEIVDLIKKSKDPEEAKGRLMSEYGLSDAQSQAILDMRLQRLTGLEQEKIEAEYQEKLALIADLKDILADERRVLQIIKTELLEVKERFGDPRRTEIGRSEEALEIEDLIAREDIVVTLSHQGYIKRVSLNTYRSQRRGGKGITAMNIKEEDFVERIFITSTHDQLLCFSSAGKVYSLRGYDIPEAGRQARGTAIVNLLPVDRGERINTVIPVSEFAAGAYLFFATEKGIVKKTDLSEYANIRSTGLIAITLEEGDCLVGVKLISGDEDIILATRHGQSIRFSHEDVRAMGRPARGVIGIRLDLDDSVVGMDTIGPADVDGSHLLVVTENGYGKRTPVSHYGVQGRGGKGLKTLQMIKKNGPIVGAKVVRDDHDLMFISAEGIVIRVKASEISVMGRLTQGVRVMTMGEGDSLVAMAKIASRDEENEANRVQEENEPEGPSDGMEELPLLPANETADEE